LDHAVSADPAVQRQLDRLTMLSPGRDVLGLERITALLARVGDPQLRLPPVFHVAGTNGKGSTCAFLRAAIEAAGLSAHVYSSPHLVRFNERIRIAGRLIDDERLAPLLADVLDRAGDIGPSFFEATTAAAFLAFAETPADACIVEVGLGGRLDATNVIPHPAACGIAQLGLDHQAFLGDRIEDIAAEKAGIARAGVPLVTMAYPPPMAVRVGETARTAGATWLPKGEAWDVAPYQGQLHYRDANGRLTMPLPRLPGKHQAMNAGLAIAMLRHQRAVTVPEAALRAATGWADWPARLQRLDTGVLRGLLPDSAALWLDGGHNPAAARAIADYFRGQRPLRMIVGLLANKDLPGFLTPFRDIAASLHAVPVPRHECHSPAAIVEAATAIGIKAAQAGSVAAALRDVAPNAANGTVLVAGSLYLAGLVLEENGTPPM
jgi:dihydrofolate synthase/folylpolyglutamate synthase